VDIYKKNSGRRDALMRLLDTAIAFSPGRELMLFSEENVSWQMDNKEFCDQWLEKYKEILRLGNRVTMIHTVDRQEPQLLHTITQWLPLHITGKTDAYYYPEYSNSIFKPSISLLRDLAVLTGMTAEGFSDTLNTFYCTEPNIVKQFEMMFSGLLLDCRPLFEKLQGGNISESILAAAQRQDSCYNYSSLPLELALDPEDFGNILRLNGVEGKKYEETLDFFTRHKAYLVKSVSNSAFKQMLNLKILEKGLTEGFPMGFFNWITGGNLAVPQEYFRKGLKAVAGLLDQHTNFSVGLIDEHPLPAHVQHITMLVKENTIIVANSNFDGTPGPLIMKESTIVRTFYNYFEHYWSSIPRIQRDKESVISRLEQLLR